MKRDVDLKEISDGRLYTANDMVKADCQDCRGCSACCRGLGESIILDPMDVFRLTKDLECTFEELLQTALELHVVDGIVLPNLKMAGKDEECVFLNREGRCNIHASRPGICRLFPLGRVYEDGGFKYFLQIHECKKEDRTKVKVRKWIDVPDIRRYETFVNAWHYFLKDMEQLLETADESLAKQISMYVLKQFYLKPYELQEDFYRQFEERLREGKELF